MPAPEKKQQFTDDERTKIAQADLGLTLEEFKRSKAGRYLIGCALQEAREALRKLKTVDPNDTKAITALQNEIWRAESLVQWVEEAIYTGKNAEQALQQQDDSSDGFEREPDPDM